MSLVSYAVYYSFIIKCIVLTSVLDNPLNEYTPPLPRDKWITIEQLIMNATVPEFIDGIQYNMSGLLVKYPNLTAFLGAELSHYHIVEEPWIDWFPIKNAFYTLLMTDGDAPDTASPKWKEWLHLLVVNIHQNSVENGEVLADYVPPDAKFGTGRHRILTFLFKQQGKQNFSEPCYITDHIKRRNFSTRKFSLKYKLGLPVNANYFYTKWRPEDEVLRSDEARFKSLRRGFAGQMHLNTRRSRNWEYNQDDMDDKLNLPPFPSLYDDYSDSS